MGSNKYTKITTISELLNQTINLVSSGTLVHDNFNLRIHKDCIVKLINNLTVANKHLVASNFGGTAKLWTIISHSDGNDTFEVTAISRQDAAEAALNEIGWSVVSEE